ncbi:high choriolytic enzyme 1-like [Engraulis encrasicolus]|uniref:high choriolytic enzyme 1-like n=1 Tax=Engraulis encrasicolus TaxID=184585 RepID=UPI002FD2EBDD
MASSTAVLLTCLLAILSPVWCYPLQANATRDTEGSGLISEDPDDPDDPELMDGDIVVPSGLQNADPSVCLWWRDGKTGRVTIPYYFGYPYTRFQRAEIMGALGIFTRNGCVFFEHHDKPIKKGDHLVITSKHKCWSHLGRKGGRQMISINKDKGVTFPIILHLAMHALGFRHEHQRSDRDQHIRINYNNIIKGREDDFKKVETDNLNAPYDYHSVMQYPGLFLSRNGRPTMVPIPDSRVPMGQAVTISFMDLAKVRNLYCKY